MTPPPRTGPLDTDEDVLWRSLMRLVVTLPRTMSDDLERSSGLNGTEYHVLVHLSEAPHQQLRMSDLAERTALSAGRITHVIADLTARGLVVKEQDPDDRRSNLAALTSDGLATLERAYPPLLLCVRANVFDHLSAAEVEAVGSVLRRVACAIDVAHPPRRTRATSQ
jgi:DNA-binding MarR family transcriptional regulator